MSDTVRAASRAAAERLVNEFGPGLIMDVEEALHRREGNGVPDHYFDPVSVGGLIVSVATLAWTIYKDLTKTTAKPPPEIMARRVRLKLETHENLTTTQRDRVVDIVVTEILMLGSPEAD